MDCRQDDDVAGSTYNLNLQHTTITQWSDGFSLAYLCEYIRACPVVMASNGCPRAATLDEPLRSTTNARVGPEASHTCPLGLLATLFQACKHDPFDHIWLGMRIGTDVTGLHSREAPPPLRTPRGQLTACCKSNRGIH